MKMPRHLRLFSRFSTNIGAMGAVEFALILPVMMLLLFATFDITRAIDVKTRTAQLSRTVSDFVSQNKTVSAADLGNIIKASKSVLSPYSDDKSLLSVEVQSINKQPGGGYQIDWSYTYGAATPADSSNQVITDYTPADDNTIRTRVTYVYNLQFAGFLFKRIGFDNVTLKSETAMSPRWGAAITASGF